MTITREHITREIEGANEEQLREVADFIAFVMFRERRSQLPIVDENQLGTLYEESAEEDQQLAEEGMAEYVEMLKKEDSL